MKRVEVFTHRRDFLVVISKEAALDTSMSASVSAAIDAIRRAPQQDQLMLEWEIEWPED
ncbi:hypothetical protein [Alteromonas genovensis]|uniref:hypothetical protein n=1 Tax=Alteromonas genovensis TaxID=471225 RepID=UPI002FE1B324